MQRRSGLTAEMSVFLTKRVLVPGLLERRFAVTDVSYPNSRFKLWWRPLMHDRLRLNALDSVGTLETLSRFHRELIADFRGAEIRDTFVRFRFCEWLDSARFRGFRVVRCHSFFW